jgi:uncharacterized damage-inducible protein DinB
MAISKLPELWLRGPVEDVSPLLQPVAHALLQAREEVNELMKDFPDQQLWQKPAGVASVGFHLRHMAGVVDRLFTYAKGQLLSDEQMQALKAEPEGTVGTTVHRLLSLYNKRVDQAIEELKHLNDKDLLENRGVGRSQLPSNVLGLLFHSAEHSMRHLGQLLVTVRVLKGKIA